MLSNWKKEFEKWAPGVDVVVYDGSPDERRLLRTEHIEKGFFNAVVTHYDLVMRDRAVLRKVGPQPPTGLPSGSAVSCGSCPPTFCSLLQHRIQENPGNLRQAGCSPVFMR